MMQNAASDEQKSELTGKQRQAALCLARGFTQEKTAAEVKVALITITRWKKLPAFLEAIKSAEDDLYNDNLRALKKVAGAAIATLISCMGEKISPYVRVQSASKLLDLGLQIHRTDELEARITELEELIEDGRA